MNVILEAKKYDLKCDDDYNNCHTDKKRCSCISSKYFVRGIAANGNHFYSEDVDWEGALQYYKKFQDSVWCLGGGTVTIFEYCGDWDYYEVLSVEVERVNKCFGCKTRYFLWR